jgi:hypothetical protein
LHTYIWSCLGIRLSVADFGLGVAVAGSPCMACGFGVSIIALGSASWEAPQPDIFCADFLAAGIFVECAASGEDVVPP